jgi:hypothetical protein
MKPPKALNKKERRYLERLEDLFLKAPARFEFVTGGDANLTVIDKYAAEELPNWDVHNIDQIEVGNIYTGAKIHGIGV